MFLNDFRGKQLEENKFSYIETEYPKKSKNCQLDKYMSETKINVQKSLRIILKIPSSEMKSWLFHDAAT